MQAGNVLRARTISTVQFTDALVTGASEVESFAPESLAAGGGGAGISAGKHMRCCLKELRILSVENLAWEIELYGSATGIGGSNIALEIFLGKWAFIATDGTRATGDTFYKYFISGLYLSYTDVDMSGKFHVRLINRSVAAKTAGAGGGIVVELGVEITQGI